MSTIINADTSDGLKFTSDTSGEIKLQSAGADIATVDSSGITMASGKAINGDIVTATPVAFYVYKTANQSISANTTTKVTWTSERFDTNNNFDNSTNYRFTPTVAGYYQLNAHVSWNGLGTTQGNLYIYQNGSDISKTYTVGSGFGYYNSVNIVAYANGSTDYFEIYARNSSTDNVTAGTQSHFSGILISQA